MRRKKKMLSHCVVGLDQSGMNFFLGVRKSLNQDQIIGLLLWFGIPFPFRLGARIKAISILFKLNTHT